MIPKEFEYVAPASVEEALKAMHDGGENAKYLAGGHSLIPLMKLRLAAPGLLIDLSRIAGLKNIGGGDMLEIGAMVTHAKLAASDELRASCPLLVETALSIGDEQVRARGTLGGSLAHADPSADLTAAVLALGATLVVSSMNGQMSTREIAAGDFFADLLTTSMTAGEMLTTIKVPRRTGRSGSAYVKIRNKASHYAMAGAAAVVTLGDDGVCTAVSVALTGVTATPFRLSSVEEALTGTRLEESDLDKVGGMLNDTATDWLSDLSASEEYRRHLAGVVTRRALQTAKSRVA